LGKPWVLSFSYGRALQTSILRAWKGRKDNSEQARKEYIRLAKVKKRNLIRNLILIFFYFFSKIV